MTANRPVLLTRFDEHHAPSMQFSEGKPGNRIVLGGFGSCLPSCATNVYCLRVPSASLTAASSANDHYHKNTNELRVFGSFMDSTIILQGWCRGILDQTRAQADISKAAIDQCSIFSTRREKCNKTISRWFSAVAGSECLTSIPRRTMCRIFEAPRWQPRID